MKSITLFILFLISLNLLGQKTYYVKTTASGKGDGLSWENAATDLQSVINNASAGDQVWVAGGSYYPTVRVYPDIERSKSFVTKEGVNVYGGFYGTERYIEQREKKDLNQNTIIEPWEFINQTILSGDLLKNDNYDNWPDNSNNDDNAFHVVFMYSDFSAETVLDGFTIRGGNTKDAFSSENWGGGVHQWVNSLLKNSVIEYNCSIGGYGGGVYSKGKVKYCVIRNNYSTYEGGGICSLEEITNSLIINNFSEGNGGGITNRGKVTNCIIANNSSTGDFNGGINNLTGKITNCTIVRNTAFKGTGGIYNNGEVYNSIIWQNSSSLDNSQLLNSEYGIVSTCALNEPMNNCILLDNENSAVQGPNFVHDPEILGYQKSGTENCERIISANWSISQKSYCIDKGDNSNASGTDILGNKRNGNADIGAYESIPIDSYKYAQLANAKGIAFEKSIYVTTDIIDLGIPSMIQYGFCYSINENPVISDSEIRFFYSQHISNFSAEIIGLSPATTYYIRPFAIHLDSTVVYGNEFSISTLKSLVISDNGIVYVKTVGTGLRDGSSWENATDDLQKAIDTDGDHEVWVQNGKYVPKVPELTNDIRKTHFLLKDGISIFGGFSGTETLKDEREKADMNLDGVVSPWEYKNQTILSGDLSGNDIYNSWPTTTNNSENCYQVVRQSDDFEIPTLLEGVIVQGGNNNSVSFDMQAAGIYIRKNIKLQNSVVQFNQASSRNAFGTGVYCFSGELDGCLIRNNFTNNETSKGTGIYIINGKLNNSNIENNTALNYYAYGVGVNAENCIIENCIIRNNYSKTKTGEGAGIWLYRGKVNNSEIINNEIENLPEFPNNQFGGGIYSQKGIITNSVIEKNKISGSGGGIYTDTTIYNSVIQYNSALSEGGGIYGRGALIYNSKIGFNKSIASGGGIFNGANESNTAVIENCEVFANSSDQDAGGIFLYYSKIINSIVYNNFCKNDYYASSGITASNGCLIANSTIVNNKINFGNGNTYALLGNGDPLILNCVIWGNNTTANQFKSYGTTKYCAVLDGDGIAEGENGNFILERENSGTKNKHPFFIQPTSFAGLPESEADTLEILNADWSLLDKSALIDVGSQDTTGLYLPDSCINGERRFVSKLDIGAYEFIPMVITLPAVVYKPDSVTYSGEITSSFIREVKERGVIYSFEQHPVIGNSKFVNDYSTNKGIFTFVLEDLEPFKNYFFRAYAISADLDTLYGEINSVYIASPLNPVNNIIYVMNEPKGDGSGSSWDNATADLAGAINVSKIGGQVWVSEGTYTPNNISKYNTDRNQSFIPKEGVHVFGGFTGGENSLEERIKTDLNGDGKTDSWEFQNKSILSGDIDSIKDNYLNACIDSLMAVMKGNSFRVVNQEKPFTTETLWEGVLIRGGCGNKDTSGNKAAGAFIQERLLLRNCIIDFNLLIGQNGMGAGIYIKNGYIDSCVVSDNYMTGELNQGTGIFSELSEIAYCKISHNSGIGEACYGGGIYNTGMVRNSDFFDNKLKGDAGKGAGVYNNSGRLINSKIFNNLNEGIKGNYYVPLAGGIYNIYGDIIGCVVFNNQVTNGYYGGICSDYGNIINTTISNNYHIETGFESTLGLKVYRTQVFNSLVWNSPLLGEEQFYYSLLSTVKYSAFQNWKNDPEFEDIINLSTGNCNNNVNSPCFVNPTNFVGIAKDSAQRKALFASNWEITDASVLLNAGLKDTTGLNLPKFTINGQPRLSSRIDIGAYEYNSESQSSPVAIIRTSPIVNEGDIVIVDGSSSFDTENNILTYNWSASGIILDSISTKTTTFSVPWISGNKEILIQLIVSDGIFNDTTTTSVFVQDVTGIEDSKQSEIRVYPNPFNDKILVQLDKPSESTIKLFSITGELCFVRKQSESTISLNTNHINSGFYVLCIETDEGFKQFKLIKN